MEKRLFIVVEGGDGAGKTTILDFLRSLLEGELVDFTREPGGTEIAEEIRALLLKRRENFESIEPETEILLFEAARAQHLIVRVRRALTSGYHVISDRFDSSTWGYEIYGNNRHDLTQFLRQINDLVVGENIPDLYVYLDVDPRIGAERRRRRNGQEGDTSYDAKDLEYHERVRKGYHQFFEQIRPDCHLIVDASQSEEEVKRIVGEAVTALLLK